MAVPVFLPSAANWTMVTLAGPSLPGGAAAITVLRRNPQKASALAAPAAEKIKARRPRRAARFRVAEPDSSVDRNISLLIAFPLAVR